MNLTERRLRRLEYIVTNEPKYKIGDKIKEGMIVGIEIVENRLFKSSEFTYRRIYKVLTKEKTIIEIK